MKFHICFLSLLPLITHNVIADHFYTTNATGELAPAGGYHLEEIACYVVATTKVPTAGTIPVYRWYSSTLHQHFWTINATGELAPAQGYKSEGIGYYVFPSPDSGSSGPSLGSDTTGSVPFYRFLGDGHFYTTNVLEGINAGFTFESVLGYVYTTPATGLVPLYRWFDGK